MTVKQTAKYRVLSDVVQTTYGKSSEVKRAVHVSVSVLDDEHISIKYHSLVNYGNRKELVALEKKYRDEAMETIKQHVKTLADGYKEAIKQKSESDKKVDNEPAIETHEEAPPKSITIKVDDNSVQDVNEFLANGAAHYRLKCIATVS